MRYMLLIYSDDEPVADSELQKCYVDSAKYARELKAAGKYIDAAPLHPVSTATTVRVREGQRLITDGPFAETREQLGGYFMVDAVNLDEAIEIAGKIPGAKFGSVEIRPVLEVGGLPEK